MDGKFSVMQRTVQLLKRYGQKLPAGTQQLFSAAPGRWNNLKTKVSLAKQRLGPRIQEESDSITKVICCIKDDLFSRIWRSLETRFNMWLKDLFCCIKDDLFSRIWRSLETRFNVWLKGLFCCIKD